MRSPSLFVALDEHTLDADVSVCRVKANGHPGAHSLDCKLGPYADYGIVRTRHARVRNRRCAAGLNAGIAGLDMGVRPDHRRHPTVEEASERHLLARGFGVEVDHHDLRLATGFLDELVNDDERMHRHIKEQGALQIDNGNRGPVNGVCDRKPGPGAAKVRGANDSIVRLEHGDQIALSPDVVAQRDNVGARGKQLARELGGQPDAVGRVLPVDDAEVDSQLLTEAGQMGLDGLATGCGLTVALTYALMAFVAGHKNLAAYLQVPNIVGAGELTVVCAALVSRAFCAIKIGLPS